MGFNSGFEGLIIPEEFYLKFYHNLFSLIRNATNYIIIILDNSFVYRVMMSYAT